MRGRPPRFWPARKGGTPVLPETQRDARLWRTELPNGMVIEEIGSPVPRLADEPQAKLVSASPAPPEQSPPPVVPQPCPAPEPTAAAEARLRNHRAITRDA